MTEHTAAKTIVQSTIAPTPTIFAQTAIGRYEYHKIKGKSHYISLAGQKLRVYPIRD